MSSTSKHTSLYIYFIAVSLNYLNFASENSCRPMFCYGSKCYGAVALAAIALENMTVRIRAPANSEHYLGWVGNKTLVHHSINEHGVIWTAERVIRCQQSEANALACKSGTKTGSSAIRFYLICKMMEVVGEFSTLFLFKQACTFGFWLNNNLKSFSSFADDFNWMSSMSVPDFRSGPTVRNRTFICEKIRTSLLCCLHDRCCTFKSQYSKYISTQQHINSITILPILFSYSTAELHAAVTGPFPLAVDPHLLHSTSSSSLTCPPTH